jgi:hypothetical protein
MIPSYKTQRYHVILSNIHNNVIYDSRAFNSNAAVDKNVNAL